VGALIVSIPLSVYSSRVSLGRGLGDYFLIPEESKPPREIRRAREIIMLGFSAPGFAAAVADPDVNALACATGLSRAGRTAGLHGESLRCAARALAGGPDALAARQKLLLLNDPLALARLHAQVRSHPQTERLWRDACQRRSASQGTLTQPHQARTAGLNPA
jgi:membrane glycosyltransferase